MATMPSRAETFDTAFRSIVRQVDKLYLYLDGHEEVPASAKNDSRVVPIFAHQCPGLRANGKFLGLTMEDGPCLFAAADDDLYYPSNYIARLRMGLAKYDDRAVVGLHGTRLARPLVGYYKGRDFRGKYTSALDRAQTVDVLGTGAVLFSTEHIRFDVRDWPRVSMADLGLAIAAADNDVPMISVSRPRYPLTALAENQADSLLLARMKDDRTQTELGNRVISARSEDYYN